MNIICEKEKILKAINSVVKAVASKTTMPILEGILIQTNDKEIKLTTYDLEIGIEYIMEAEVKEEVKEASEKPKKAAAKAEKSEEEKPAKKTAKKTETKGE